MPWSLSIIRGERGERASRWRGKSESRRRGQSVWKERAREGRGTARNLKARRAGWAGQGGAGQREGRRRCMVRWARNDALVIQKRAASGERELRRVREMACG